jgi:succinoglycan biosynthesis transport protein ExoP
LPEEQELSLGETLSHLRAILRRRAWWILLPTAIVAFATLVVLSYIPNRYTSEATLVVIQQQVPERYVVSTSTTDIREALEATKQEVLSRTLLLGLIKDFNLYPAQQKRLSGEGLTKLMLKDITIVPIEGRTGSAGSKDLSAFSLSFTANSPQTAEAITTRLTSLFIEKNNASRERQATTTTTFLHEQVEAAKRRVAEQEERVRDFKLKNLGELPEQQGGNLAVLSGLQAQLQTAGASLSHAREQRVYLESLYNGNEGLANSLAGKATSGGADGVAAARGPSQIDALREELTKLQTEKALLTQQYTPQHPDIQRVNQRITATETVLKALLSAEAAAAAKPAQTGKSDPAVPAVARRREDDPFLTQLRNQMNQVKSQLEANSVEIANLTKDEERLKTSIKSYQARLEQTPVREQELAGYLRDYEQSNKEYKDLLSKEMESQLAGSLEKRQQGQQFHLIDQPSLPTVPSSPKRIPISLGGLAGGLVIGLALALIVDMADTSFHSEDQLRKGLPAYALIISIPPVLTPGEEKGRKWKRALDWCAAVLVLIAIVAAEGYEYFLYRNG